jgi:hypothetical protein
MYVVSVHVRAKVCIIHFSFSTQIYLFLLVALLGVFQLVNSLPEISLGTAYDNGV